MALTDELRNGGTHLAVTDRRAFGEEELTSIADRIDREHRMAMEKVAAEADALPMTDESMVENGWVRLPVDADGVPIHVGDRLADGECTFTAYELAVYGDGSWSIRNEDGIAWAACDLTHCAQTVEDVLREFAEKITDSQIPNVHPTYEEAIAEYAKRLQLVEEGDE